MNNLPRGWEVKTLGECLTYEQPTKYIVKNTQYSDEYEIPVLTAGKSFLLGYTNDTENIFTQTPVIIFDDFTTDSKFVDFHFKVKSSAMKILHATKIANIKFVFYFMQTIQYRSDTHKRYWISEYAKLPIPLPPLETQKAIVEKLESAFAHIDEAVRHLKAVQTNIPRLKSSLLHCAFSGKLTESQNQSHEVQTLKSVVGVEGEFEREEGATSQFKPLHPLIKAEIPQGWEVKTLGEVCEIYTGNSINQAKKEKEFTNLKEGLNYIATKDIGFDNVINYNNGVKIPFEKVKDFKTAKVNSSLLCIEGGSAGRKIGFTNQKVCFVNKLCCFETLQDEPRFIYYYLQSDYFMQKFRLNMSGLIGGVSKDRIKQIQIPLPPLETQKQIVQILESKFTHLEKLAQFVNESLENLQKLKSSLLNQAFKGELVC